MVRLQDLPGGRRLELPRMYIENREKLSEWLLLEYRHCIQSWEDLVFTNVKDPRLFGALKGRAPVRRASLSGLKEFRQERTAVLDPSARTPLRPSDAGKFKALVVGGILGHEGFTGKTGSLVTARLGCRARNLGGRQLSIDSAVVVCKLVMLGMELDEMELSSEVEIEHGGGRSTVLPYGYPVLGGKVIFTPGLREYLRRH